MVDRQWHKFETYIQKLMEDEHIAGAAVAVSQHGEVIYQKGFGVSDLSTQKPVTPETIFGIASITKSITAMVIMQLEKEGKLSVDDSVVTYLPEFHLHGVEDMSNIKINHLLSHTTGLPPMRRREDLNKLNDHLNYLEEEKYDLLGKPGDHVSYCNDTFLLLGAIIERVTGRLYRRYITEKILNPLRMDRSTYSLEEVAKFNNVSVPYVYNIEKKILEEVNWPLLGNYEVGGGVRSTVLDLLKYGQVYVGEHTDSFRKMWQPLYPVGRNSYYGYALKTTLHYSDFTLIEHGGGQPGVSSNFGFVPEKGLVVAILTNVSGAPVGDIWLTAVNTALGIPLEQKRSVEPYYDASIEQLQRLVGTYSSAEGGKATILLEGDTPKVEVDGQQFDLRASDERTLVIKKNEQPIRFFFTNNETPWAIFFGLRMLRKVKD